MERDDVGPNPRRVAAGRANREKRGPLTAQGRRRLREAALAGRPWEQSTGPRTAEGKERARQNGKRRQVGPLSVREVRAHLASVRALVRAAEEVCAGVPGGPAGRRRRQRRNRE